MRILVPVREDVPQVSTVEASRAADRPQVIRRLGLLDNGKPGAGRLVKEMARRLGEGVDDFEVRLVVKHDPDYSHVSSDEELADLLECDAVLTAMGN